MVHKIHMCIYNNNMYVKLFCNVYLTIVSNVLHNIFQGDKPRVIRCSIQSKRAGTGRLWLWVSGPLGWQGVDVVFSLKQQAPDDISVVGSESGL